MKIADYQHDLFTYAKLLLGIDSPTGYTTRVVDAIGQVAESLEFGFEKTTKGCGLIHVPGGITVKSSGFRPYRHFGRDGSFHQQRWHAQIYAGRRSYPSNVGR